MFPLSLLSFASLIAIAVQSCPGIDGDAVPWWILYQQKNRAFIHYYVDSKNTEDIVMHFPEKVDSVLSRVIQPLIDNEQSQYMVYFSDLVNAMTIAKSLKMPTNSKWMQGILSTSTSWSSGTWVLSNNLLFPPIKDGSLLSPGSKQWTMATVGDSGADLFYACLSAESRDDIGSIFQLVYAGNPFIVQQKLNRNAFNKEYLQEIQIPDSSFGLEASANMFLECMNAFSNETLQRCLYKYSVGEGISIKVFTRPRGMLKHSRAFCHDTDSLQPYEFGVQGKTYETGSDWTNSMFVLTDQSSSPAAGITCFGQDIAANTETVAIMICVKMPGLYKHLLKLSKISSWTCRNLPTESVNVKKENSIKTYQPLSSSVEQEQTEQSGDNLPAIRPLADHSSIDGVAHQSSKIAFQPEETLLENTKSYFNRKNITKFCELYDCSTNTRRSNRDEQKVYKDSLKKTRNVAKVYAQLTADVQLASKTTKFLKGSDGIGNAENQIGFSNRMQDEITKKTKVKAVKKKPYITIQNAEDAEKFLVKNNHNVLALFYREGCTYCQNAKEELLSLRETQELNFIDKIVVDVQHPCLPTYLNVPWVPFIRYKTGGAKSNWVDYIADKYDKLSVVKFLKNVITGKWSNRDNYIIKKVNGSMSTAMSKVLSKGSPKFSPVSTVTPICGVETMMLACKLLELHNKNIILLTSSHVSEKIDNAFAFNNIRDTCNGRKASRSSYECEDQHTAPGGEVCLQPNLLRYIYDLASEFPYIRLQINELAGACHSKGSKHYIGIAVDLGCYLRKSTTDECNYKNRINIDIVKKCVEEYNGKTVNHTSHIHCSVYKK